MLGIQTRGGRMEGANESTELRRHPYSKYYLKAFSKTLERELTSDVEKDSKL